MKKTATEAEIKALADQMTVCRWWRNGGYEHIRLDANGHVIDGQQRLAALVEK